MTENVEGQVEVDAMPSISTHDSVNTNSLQGDSLLTGDFSELESFPNRFVRNAALHQKMMRSNENELFELLAKTSNIARQSIRDDVQLVIVHRLATLNPIDTLKKIENLQIANQSTLVALIFGEWAIKNLDDAVNHAKTLETRKKFLALRGILRSRDDLSDHQHRDIAAQLGVKHLSDDLLSQSADYEIIQSPDLAWQELANDAQTDLSQIDTLTRIAENWIERDGLDVIETIYSSITDWQIRMPVLSSALHKTTLRDPQATFDHAMQLNFDQGNFLVSSVVQSWATVDPEGALGATATLGSSALRTQLQESIVRVWGSKDPSSLLSSINLLPSSMQASGREHGLVAMSRTDPAMASTILAEHELGARKLTVAHEIAKNWSDVDANAALDWVLSTPHVAEIQMELLPTVLGNLAKEDPQLAMDIALDQPINDEQQRGMEATVISYLAVIDPQIAVQMLPRVRDGSTRVRAYSSVGSQLIHDGDIDQALTLGDDLSDTEQMSYFESIIDSWVMSHPVDLLDRMNKLPNDEIKSRAARRLIAFNQFRKALNDDQIDSARKFLPKEE